MELCTIRTTTIAAPALLNLGCGRRFHPAWTNLDLTPSDPSIRRLDVTKPLPFVDGSFDAVYHSHLLEHLPRERAPTFLGECRRVLKPGGVLRLAIPDLEVIARLYLDTLDDAWAGDSAALERHRWLVMEMYDQTARETPGGAMATFLRNETVALAWHRIGVDGPLLRKEGPALTLPVPPPTWRERLIRWLLGAEYPLLAVGRFRRAGEVHHWMYDRVALRTLLVDAGFTNVRCVAADESAIANWNDYHLDVSSDGTICKPDSLFVEADKP